MSILLTLLPTLTTSFLLVINAFGAKFDNLVVFNSKLGSIAILLKL